MSARPTKRDDRSRRGRRGRRILAGALVASSLSLLATAAAAEAPGAGVHYPLDARWNALYFQLDEKLASLTGPRAAEELVFLIRELEQAQLGSGVRVHPMAVPAGRGYALGARAAFERLVGRLAPPDRERFAEAIEIVLRERWANAPPEPHDPARARLRHEILRDFPHTSLALELAREDIAAQVESGQPGRALRSCDRVLEHRLSDASDRAAALWTRLELARVLDDRSLWERTAEHIGRWLEDAEARGPETEPLAAALRATTERPLDAPDGAAAVRSPLRIGQAAVQAAPEASDFELGSVQLRRPFSSSELRSYLDSRAPPRFPRVSAELSGGESPSSRPEHGPRGRDIALPFFPVAWQDRLYLQGYRELVAIDLPSLRELWATPLEEDSFEALDTLRCPAVHPDRVVLTAGASLMAVAAADGAVEWKHRIVYSRPRKGLLLTAQEVVDAGGEALLAGSDETDGSGGPDTTGDAGNDEPATDLGDPGADAAENDAGRAIRRDLLPVTLTPAAIHGDSCIVAAHVRVDSEILVYLLSYAADGRPLWSSYIGSVESSDYLGMASTLSPPLLASGRVFLQTNLGFFACTDAFDGQLLWLQAYPRMSERGKTTSIELRDRWQPNPALHLEGRVYAAPRDANTLFEVSLKSGALLRRAPRGDHTTLLGAHGGRLILGGPVISAVRLDRDAFGSTVWSWEPDSAALVTLGRGFLGDDTVFVSDINALYAIGAESGQLLSMALWDFRGGGGNLLPLPSGHLAVGSAGGFLVYNHRERERERIALLDESSEARLLAAARHRLKAGEVFAGLETLREWRRRSFPEPAANSATDRLLFEIAEILRYTVDLQGEESARSPDLLELLMETERLPRNRAVAAFRAAHLYNRHDRPRDAVRVLRAALNADLGSVPCPIHDHLSVPGRVLAESILESIRNGDAAAQAAFREFGFLAEDALARARRLGTPDEFESVVTRFPLTRAASVAQRELARYFLEQQLPRQGVAWLIQNLRKFPESPEYVETALEAADLYTRLEQYEDARDLLMELARSHGDAKVPADVAAASEETVAQYVGRRLKDPGFRDVDLPLEGRWLRFPVRALWRSPANLLTTQREFLQPEGDEPELLEGRFLTHSDDLIECRDTETGLPVWTVEFAMVPTLEQRERSPFRSYRKTGAQYHGNRLIYHDSRDVLAIDLEDGKVLWHLDLEDDGEKEGAAEADLDSPGQPRSRFVPVLSERVYDVRSGDAGTFVRSSRGKLHGFDPDGRRLWDRQIDLESPRSRGRPLRQNRPGRLPAADRILHGPFLLGEQLFVVLDPPLELQYLDPGTGEVVATLPLSENSGTTLRQPPLIDGDRGLFLFRDRLITVDLAARQIVSEHEDSTRRLRRVWRFPAYESQAIVSYERKLGIAAVSLDTGEELWSYDDFRSLRTGEVHVYFDGRRIFVLHGEEKRRLAALEVKEGPDPGKFTVVSRWPSEITIATFLMIGKEPNIRLTEDSIIFHDSLQHSISVYDKETGRHRGTLTEPIDRFLVDKPRFQVTTRDALLIFLTDRGDCAFESNLGRLDLRGERERVQRLTRYLREPRDWENIIHLSLQFFQDGNSPAALRILNDALLSEHLPSLESPGMYQKLKFLLDGIKQEAIKSQQPLLVARRFRSPPNIDGRLNESWNYSHRMELVDLSSINEMPAPGQEPDVWKGEEDLSARLYTGWDADYFYFAFDVEDNRIYPYDRKATHWKGDCLIIGIDPTGDGGTHYRGNDQLLTLALTVPNRQKDDKKPDGQQDDEQEEEEEKKKKPAGDYAVKKKEDDSGVIYEVAIPWSSFDDSRGLAPMEIVEGMRFGLSLVVTDDDSGQGATKMLSLTPCHLLPREQESQAIWTHLIPEYFPKIVLR